jgi:hypothetical protein
MVIIRPELLGMDRASFDVWWPCRHRVEDPTLNNYRDQGLIQPRPPRFKNSQLYVSVTNRSDLQAAKCLGCAPDENQFPQARDKNLRQLIASFQIELHDETQIIGFSDSLVLVGQVFVL